jgi:DNA-binding NarL/FixJ family response regulator
MKQSPPNPLHRKPEGIDVGVLAARRISSEDRAVVWTKPIQQILAATGGIRPAQRSRSRLALTLAEREEISRAVVTGQSIRSIAIALGRAASTISCVHE